MSPLVWDLAHCRQLRGAVARPRARRCARRRPAPRRPLRRLRALALRAGRAWSCSRRRRRAATPPTCGRRSLDRLEQVELERRAPARRTASSTGWSSSTSTSTDETMLATLQLREAPYPPADEPAPAGRRRAAATRCSSRGGAFVMGTDDEPWAYDNERGAHDVDLPAYWIDRVPVTNRGLRPVRRRRRLPAPPSCGTSTAGRSARRTGIERPQFWRREDDALAALPLRRTGSRCRRTSRCSTSAGTRPTPTRAGRASGCRPRRSGRGGLLGSGRRQAPLPLGRRGAAARACEPRQRVASGPAPVGAYPEGASP